MPANTVNSYRLRISTPMSLGLVLSVAGGFFLLQVFSNASRSIGWIVFSATIALMLYPAVALGTKFLPRPVVVVALMLFVIVMIVVPVYSVVDDVNSQTAKLERTLPQRAAQLEEEGRFAQSFREFGLEERTRSVLDAVPNVLQGGDEQAQIKANANRAIAFVAGGVLMLFFLLYGHKLVRGALTVIESETRHKRAEEILARAYHRCTIFGWSQIGLSIAVWILTYVVCRIVDIPAAGLLSTWVALWNVLPVFGVLIGTLPIIILAGAQSFRLAIFLLVLFLAYEALESFARHRLLGPHALRMDAITTTIIVFGGVELYGLGGALAGLVIGAFLHALASEIASTNPE